jgi:hypothetical protein
MTNEVPKHASLIEALAAAQGEFEMIPKSKKVDAGSRKYHYADLAGVLAVVRPVLSRHGIALVQPIEQNGEGLILHTRLCGYGETLGSSMPLVAQLSNPQALGSVLTYCRRYSLCSLVGVAADDDDDDGEAAGRKPQPQAAPRAGVAPREKPVVPPDDAWLEAARLKIEHSEPDDLKSWWNSESVKLQRQDLHRRRADLEPALAELKARVATRWWECSSLEVPPGDMGWQRWQGILARSIDAAPTVDKLAQLEADNAAHLTDLAAEVSKAYAALMAKFENARASLSDNDGKLDLGGENENE